MRFELCVPAHNEAQVIGPTASLLVETLDRLPSIEWRVVVADNASTDGTADVIDALAHARVSAMRIVQQGKGAAIRSAAAASSADLFGFIDADLSADPADIPRLLDPVLQGQCDIAVGSRLVDSSRVERGWLRTSSSRVFNALLSAMLPLPVRDAQCGLKVMNAKARMLLAECREDGWFLDAEFLARASRQGLCIVELPITWTETRYVGRQSKLRMFRDGFSALVAMRRIAKSL
jgi:glycosyltransferase involved in cell wall biosynthesis